MKKSLWRKIAAAGIVIAGALVVSGIFVIGLNNENATDRDFIQYWAAGQLLVHHGNPYDLRSILQLERAAGMDSNDPKASVGPPVALVLLVPLGLVNAKLGLIIWLFALLACLSISIRVFWIVSEKPDSRYHLLGYIFAPALACMQAGQLGIFFLLGLVLFFYLNKPRPFLAGVVLLPCALKPHLFLPFAIVLILWVMLRKTYGVIAGFTLALLATCGTTLLFDRAVWSEYSAFMHTTRLMQLNLPTLSAKLRFLVAPGAVWLQYVPTVAACLWALWYFWTRRGRWNWMDHGLTVLLVSVMCAPYAWVTDEAVLLPAVLAGVYCALDTRRSLLPIAIFGAAALIELFANLRITAWYYTWTTPAWLAWYLYATRAPKISPKTLDDSPAVKLV